MTKNKYFDTLYQDDSIIVVNKKPGLAVVPTRDPNEVSLVKVLQAKYDTHIFVVHRIDRDTSGIIVFAFNEEAHKILNAQFYKREVEKYYICLSKGLVKSELTSVKNRLSLDKSSHKMKVDSRGKEATSHYKSLETSKKFSKVLVKIDTGRTHQVRVHMATQGYPILGDNLYNLNPNLKLSDIKRKYNRKKGVYDEPSLMKRCALHARSLQFTHPLSEKVMKFEADLPKDMRACWNQICKWDV